MLVHDLLRVVEGPMKKILWVGDAGCPSGFGRATHEIVDSLDHRLGGSCDVTVLGINYLGDPHPYPYPIYAAAAGGDGFGVFRLIWMCERVKPDLIVLQNDGWNIPIYVQQLRRRKANGEYLFPECASIPVVAAVAIDGKNFVGEWLDGVEHAIFWTQFALDEAREGGYKGPASVIPLGVDTGIYRPLDQKQVRLRLPEQIRDVFLVGNVNRNQPRKRWDLTVRYFARWINERGIRDAYLYLHTAPTGDTGTDVQQLASYYGVVDRLALVQPEVAYGISELDMAETYNCFDVQVTTTQGEGFGLTTLEGAACGIGQIVPGWSALGEVMAGAANVVDCTSTAIGPPYKNILGGVADERQFVNALAEAYENRQVLEQRGAAALARALEPRFRWRNVGKAWASLVDGIFDVQKDEARQEVIA